MISIVMPYYENGGMLDRHFQEWRAYGPEVKRHFQAIIIDDGSPNDPAANHWDNPGFPCALYRIKQDIIWNVAGARNLGMKVAPEVPCLLTDIDHLLTRWNATLLAYAALALNPRHYLLLGRRWADGRPLHPHPNSFVLYPSLYWRTGGCDEDWAGFWGAGEQVFRKTLQSIAGTGFTMQSIELTHYGRDDIEDASTRAWGRRNTKYDWRNNVELTRKAHAAPYVAQNPLRFEWERLI